MYFCRDVPRMRENVLERLESKLFKSRWAYQLAMTKLELSEVLLAAEDWQGAASRARDSLRLAKGNACVNLQARAHYLKGKISVLQVRKK